MALGKTIYKGGVPLTYHRIDMLSIVVNRSNVIMVNSVFDQAARTNEVSRDDAGVDVDTFNEETVYEAPYDPEMTISEAYLWLKTLPEFVGAEDV